MNSLTEIMLWGGLALVLSCGLLVALAYALIFREPTGSRKGGRHIAGHN